MSLYLSLHALHIQLYVDYNIHYIIDYTDHYTHLPTFVNQPPPLQSFTVDDLLSWTLVRGGLLAPMAKNLFTKVDRPLSKA